MLIQPALAWEPSVTVTRLAITVWAAKLRFDALGRTVPYGKTVSRLDADPLTSVTLSTAAVASFGICVPDPTMVTCTPLTAPGPSGPPDPGLRVSRIR